MESISVLDGVCSEGWFCDCLSIFVFGASGDLSKKKTYPALLDLFHQGLLPKQTLIYGYARSEMSDDKFRGFLKPYLEGRGKGYEDRDKVIEEFLKVCTYHFGGYDNSSAMKKLSTEAYENHKEHGKVQHRLFYLALPPEAFLVTTETIKKSMILSADKNPGFVRVVVEKPFGKDTESAQELSDRLETSFVEKELYRIDHYLGKELVQNIIFLRFANTMTEAIWSRTFINSVTITFKEDIGTDGRGGYFEKSGIIRDILQNHLLQVLSLIAMEPPVKLRGEESADMIRDEKVKVLNCMTPWKLEDCVLGQYEGYRDDPTVDPKSRRETFCCVVTYINNRRWANVPFILKAGKSLDERKAEVRIQLKNPPAYHQMFNAELTLPRQEIVIRLQPDEAIYVKTNVKKPGLGVNILQSELGLTYSERHQQADVPDAYTRLILDVLRGKQSMFVRKDELMAAWKIVTPLLNEIESDSTSFPLHIYKKGSRGPEEADELIKSAGYKYFPEYAENWNQKL